MKVYDYIFTGAGASAWSLLLRMIDAGLTDGKRVLVIDKAPKEHNDRTWCFWEQSPGYFESLVHHEWKDLAFHSTTFSSSLELQGYSYKMIRGIDFYKNAYEKIRHKDNIELRYGNVEWKLAGEAMQLFLNDEPINTDGAAIFNSILPVVQADPTAIDLLQHFKGWLIETPENTFDPGKAILMDFRTSQQEGATFVYVLPISPTRALVEYTLFTAALLTPEQYDAGLKEYINKFLPVTSYTIIEEEFGIIPMTTRRFPFFQNGIYNIGTAGGQTKASTGYTFQYIQKQSTAITSLLKQGKPLPGHWPMASRFHFYDTVLLRLLQKGKPSGAEIFTRLFQRNKASAIFRFLDNETSLPQEIAIMHTLQKWDFFMAAMRANM